MKNRIHKWLWRLIFDVNAEQMDEYADTQVHRLGTQVLVGGLVYFWGSQVLTAVLLLYLPAEPLLVSLVVCNLVALIIGQLVITHRVRQLHLNDLEIAPREYPQVLRQLRWRGVRYGGGLGLLVLAINCGLNGLELIGYWVGFSLVLAFLSGYDRYTTLKGRIRQVEE